MSKVAAVLRAERLPEKRNAFRVHWNTFVAALRAPRMGIKEQAFFMKRLSFLIRSGMPIVTSLDLLRTQTRSRSLNRALASIQEEVEGGQRLSESLAAFPSLFGRFSLEVIRVGEASGTLSQNLEYLAVELTKKSQLSGKLIGALIYPILITSATVALTVALILFIFPKILPIFSGLGVELPWPTRVLLGVSDYLREWGLLTLVLAVIVIVAATFAYTRSDEAKASLERLVLSIPLLGSLVRSYHLANISRTLSLLLTSGMTLRTALPATALSTSHVLYRRELLNLSETIEKGGDLAAYLRSKRMLFPDLVSQMVAVGESSGTLSETLKSISEFYENEFEDYTKNLSTLVEPVLMIVMGVIVGFVAVSMILPIYQITQHLHVK